MGHQPRGWILWCCSWNVCHTMGMGMEEEMGMVMEKEMVMMEMYIANTT